jgi:hypothetical protein
MPGGRGKRRATAAPAGFEIAAIGHLSELVERLAPRHALRGQSLGQRRIVAAS